MKRRIAALMLGMTVLAAALMGCGNTDKTPAAQTKAPASEESTPAEEESTQPEGDGAEADSAQAVGDGSVGSDKEAEITIYTYYSEAAKVTIDAAMPEMQKLYPNVTFHIEHRTDADGSVLRTRAAVGELPEITELTGALTETFVQSGDILPLDDAIERTGFIDKFIPGALDGKQFSDGHYYAIGPSIPENAMFYYNRSVFEELGLNAPKNYDEFKNVVQTLKDAGKIPLALFGQEQWPGLQMYDLAVIAEGNVEGIGALEKENIIASDGAYLRAAEKLQELVQMGMIGSGAFSTNSAQAMENVKLGNAGMYFCGAWYLNDCVEYGDNIDFFDYNPFADAGKEEELRWYKSGGKAAAGGYGVSANCEDPDLIKEIALQFSIEKTRAATKATSAINLLSEDVQPDQPRSESFERYATSVTSYENMSKYGWALESPELYTVLQSSTEKLLTGTVEPEAYIAELDQLISEIE